MDLLPYPQKLKKLKLTSMNISEKIHIALNASILGMIITMEDLQADRLIQKIKFKWPTVQILILPPVELSGMNYHIKTKIPAVSKILDMKLKKIQIQKLLIQLLVVKNIRQKL